MTKLKETIANIVAKFETETISKFVDVTINQNDSTITVRVDGETIEVGSPIFLVTVDSEGTEQVTPLADGSYEGIIEDKIVVVIDGIVTEINDVTSEEVPSEEVPAMDTPVSTDFSEVIKGFKVLSSKIEQLQSELKEMKSVNETVKSDLAKFAAQPAMPALEVPKKISKDVSVNSIHEILRNK
jgi:hypothetical protein